ncbi:MAG: C40 family peptidase [Planctomycetes bacterium]|nr:C40 family peptidase [Planctomycetota bacterium]
MNASSLRHVQLTARAQVSTEVVAVVGLVALSGMVVTSAFGRQIAGLFSRSTQGLGTGQVAAAIQVDPTGNYDGTTVQEGADIADDLVGPNLGGASLFYDVPAAGGAPLLASAAGAPGGAGLPGEVSASPSPMAKLASYYSDPAGYAKVYDQVINHGYGSIHNGCVAFMSTALRQAGVKMPQDGHLATRVNLPFSNYLEKTLGWKRITKASELTPGDVVFTQNGKRFAGSPAHTYMFAGWSDQKAGVAWVVDNQGAKHNRNIWKGGGGFNFTPFQYALRAP